MKYVSPAEASEYYKVCTGTLREWADQGKIQFTKTSGGHRRYGISDEKSTDKQDYIYTRVSSKKQIGDLQRQTNYLKKGYPNYSIVEDIGSGLNFKRQGFRKILEQLFKGNIGEVIVSSSDRFSRFGTRDFFVWLFNTFGGKLTILKDQQYASPNEELAEDLLEIITVFSARYYGRRKTDNKKDKNLPKRKAKRIV
jgi:excisionase family DNA binding protein